jgi:hypothetical protein
VARLQDRSARRRPGLVVYGIHREVKRTQLYLDEEMARVLAAESQRRGTTVSWLVREAVARQFGRQGVDDRAAIIDRLAGVWADRDDLGDTESMIRRERRSSRPARWVRKAHAQVPARQRRRH